MDWISVPFPITISIEVAAGGAFFVHAINKVLAINIAQNTVNTAFFIVPPKE